MSDIRTLPCAEPLPENPLDIAPRRPDYCRHDSIILDEHERTVRCRACDALLDPFGFLLGNAHTLQRAWQHHRHVLNEVHDLNARLHELKKQEQRLRAQVKRLQEKTSPLTKPKE